MGKNGCQWAGWTKRAPGDDEYQDRGDLEQNHDVVGPGGFADTPDQHDGQNQHDKKGGKIEAQMPAWLVDRVALQVGEAGGQEGGRDPTRAGAHAEPIHEVDNVGGEANAHRHVADGVLQDEIPAYDPGDQFAHGGVGVGVGAAGDGNHRGELGIAEPGEGADDRHQNDGESEGRPCSGATGQGMVVHQVIEQRRVQNRGGVKLFSRDGSADHGENSRTDHRADAQRGQRPGSERFLQTVLGKLRVADQLIDRLGCEQLLSQRLGSWQG